jgi:SAM-dependent methyltransferase
MTIGEGTKMHVWEVLTRSDGNTAYGDVPISEVVDSVTGTPRVGLEIGCNCGATGAELKRRFPDLHYIGVETCAAAADIAKERLDQVITEDFLAWNGSLELPEDRPVDLVVATDVLEHLYNPWGTLKKIRSILSSDARLYATIPNVRNLWLLGELAKGNWNYERVGLLDITHIRFFTLATAIQMFESTGYEVLSVMAIKDARLPDLTPPPDQLVNVQTGELTLHALDQNAVMELTTLKFLIVATPLAAE